ncbi:rod shape-determining protein RodA [Paenalcaligenes niemegkensis]|uniref:rod shape-determining protein RodA n=1 Tax=Paenalcaligenes niemegkensis TaxID=2895469 RepID=UPI001EE8B70F|nr:rod shape-determining protein RodA [Paenalcaligenes niemegkensis]MCQ9615497.1 rod shape-determining protein RodA [Paenalcaligenes niemegkensis]
MKRVWQWGLKALTAFDWPLLILLLIMAGCGLVVMHSAVGSTDWRFADQSRHFMVAFLVMWAVALVPPPWIMRFAPYVYAFSVLMLLGVEFYGESSKGATRWLNFGVARIQPSEMLKISVPLMLAWYFHRNQGSGLRIVDFLAAGLLLAIPFLLIVRQPDLGTALLVFAAGLSVIYFAGLSFKLLVPVTVLLAVALGVVLYYEDQLCAPAFDWVVLRDYQKHRVCTLLNPGIDPLGRGFHTIQSMIAVGSGGLYGKGYMLGTQTHLDFIPERTTDFIFAVFAEEFGLYGGIMLLVLYALIILRSLAITVIAPTQFTRLVAGSMSMMLFVYVFVNIGMVTGILPVVGVPLPFMSYGGTALLTLGVACGLLMGVYRYRPDRV